MKKTLSTYEAADLLKQDDNESWSRAGALALVEYLEEIEADTGEEIEFDAVAIGYDYSEYADLQDWAGDYFGTIEGEDQAAEDVGYEPDDDDETKDDAIREYIRDNGQLIEFNGGIVVSSF